MKKKLIKLKDKLIKNLKRIKTEKLISNYFKDNKLFIVYVLVCVINSTLLRFFTMPTMENYLSFKAIIADTAVVTIIGSFSYLFKAKKRYTYLLICAIIFTSNMYNKFSLLYFLHIICKCFYAITYTIYWRSRRCCCRKCFTD